MKTILPKDAAVILVQLAPKPSICDVRDGIGCRQLPQKLWSISNEEGATAFAVNFTSHVKEVQHPHSDPALSEKTNGKELKASSIETFSKTENASVQPGSESAELIKCVACTDEVLTDVVVQAPCTHYYCYECLEKLFRSSLKDETLFPPKCCKRSIPITNVLRLLPRDIVSDFNKRQDEYDAKDKTYCFRPNCSAFIRPDIINGNLARCQRCKEATCADCKKEWHRGQCQHDKSTDQLLATVSENQWRSCPACKRIVEITFGCNHIM